MWISAPNMDVWWLAFIGWVPLLWAIHGRSPRQAFGYGLISGFVSVFVGFFWMSELLTRFAGFGTAGAAGITALFALWLGLQWAIPSAISNFLVARTGRSTLLIFPMAWAAVEFLLPSIFPVYMALSWAWHPLWIQVAEIGGAVTVSFVMVAINAAAWEVLRVYLDEGRLASLPAATLAAWLIGVPSYGALRIHQVEAQMEAAPKLKVGIVQGNFGIETYSTPAMKPLLLRELQQQTAELQQEGAQVVLWGETAYPYGRFTRQHETDLPIKDRRRIQRGFDVPVIVGLITRDATRQNPYAWNTAWVLDAEGRWGTRYDKNYPLMFGEAAPPGIDPEWYLRVIPSASHLNRGDGPARLEVGDYQFGALICYEDILPRFTREVANQGVHAIVNLTNDSWFGQTREQAEHLGLGVYRAIEHRKPLLRSVNAGISAYVDPTGRVVHQTKTTDSDSDGYQGAEGFVAEAPMMDPQRRTLYGVTGDLFAWLCISGLLGLWGWAKYHRARQDA
nr:apolipoprotein N-acyltransferase [Pseudenhygromyxa sp. WMMC2535]